MKKYLFIAIALVAAAAVSSCNDISEQDSGTMASAVQFTSSIGGYTKATDTAFESGDRIGLFAGEPINVNNLLLTSDGSTLTPANQVFWGEGQQSKTVFRAYYPYSEEVPELGETMAFYVRENQSNKEGYTSSDLMIALTEAGPDDGTVHLAFDHKMSKVSISFDNLTGDLINEVRVGGFAFGAVVNGLTGEIVGPARIQDDASVITPWVEKTPGSEGLSFILPPQEGYIGVIVYMASGKTFAFETSGNFVSGKQYRGRITLNEYAPEGETVQFDLSIAPWEEGGNIRFTDAEVGERAGWRAAYFKYSEESGYIREIIQMEEITAGIFRTTLPDYRANDYIYILSNNNNYIYGCRLEIPQNLSHGQEWPAVNGGYFQLADYEGELIITFLPDEGILRYDPVYENWKYLGTGEMVEDISQFISGAVPRVYEARVYEDGNHPGKYYFQSEVANVTVNAQDPDKVWMRPFTFTSYRQEGWDNWLSETFRVFSPVSENRVTEKEDAYGTLEDGVIRPGMLRRIHDDGSLYDFYTTNFQLVLPGYKRNPVLGFSFSYLGYFGYDDLLWYSYGQETIPAGVRFQLFQYPDIENIRYMLFSGKLADQEACGEILDQFRNGAGETLEFEAGRSKIFSLPVSQTGRYTMFMYADAPSAKPEYYRWQYQYFTIEVEGSDTPEASVSLSGAAPYGLFPESVATVHVDFPNASVVRLRAVSQDAVQEAGLTEDDYYSYAMDSRFKSGNMSFMGDNTGMDVAITGLLPETDYLIIAAGDDVFGQSAWTSATVRTAAAPTSWEDAGTGEWIDNTWMTGGYRHEVQILKESGKERYRAVNPYANYWTDVWPALAEENPEDYEGIYLGTSTDFDFGFVQDRGATYIYYAPYFSGYQYAGFVQEGTDTGWLEFSHYDLATTAPASHAYVKNNVEMAAGIYNIAPYVAILGTNYYYNWLNSWDGVVLAMPGAQYTTNETAAAPRPARKNYVEREPGAPVRAEHKVLPFTRQPLGTGKVQNDNLK